MNMRKVVVSAFVIALVFSGAPLQAKKKPSSDSSLPANSVHQSGDTATLINDESSQDGWESDVEQASRAIKKLKLRLARKERSLAVKTHENNGLRAMLSGDHSTALREFKAAIRLDPGDHNNYIYLAGLYTARGDYEGALEAYGIILKRAQQWLLDHPKPEDQKKGAGIVARIYGDRGVAYMMMKEKYTEALADSEAAFKNHPRPGLMLVQKSQALIGLKRFREAAQAYSKAVAMDAGVKKLPSTKMLCWALAKGGYPSKACK